MPYCLEDMIFTKLNPQNEEEEIVAGQVSDAFYAIVYHLFNEQDHNPNVLNDLFSTYRWMLMTFYECKKKHNPNARVPDPKFMDFGALREE